MNNPEAEWLTQVGCDIVVHDHCDWLTADVKLCREARLMVGADVQSEALLWID